jgi:predicted N-formylglutamate amidohydrolase
LSTPARAFTAALREHLAFRNTRAIAYDLEGLAVTAGLSGCHREALVYLSASRRLRDEAGAPLHPAEEAELARAMEPTLAALTSAEERQARNDGRTRPLEAVVAGILEYEPESGQRAGVEAP